MPGLRIKGVKDEVGLVRGGGGGLLDGGGGCLLECLLWEYLQSR